MVSRALWRSTGIRNAHPPGGEDHVVAADSATLLGDLDILATSEWQSLGCQSVKMEEELIARTQAANCGFEAYAVALQALWHNCPVALGGALDVVGREIRLMTQKLEFTRIRQCFVDLCQRFRACGGPLAQVSQFLADVATVQKRCEALLELQIAEKKSALPGLVTKRDTVLLQSRIRDISTQLAHAAKRPTRVNSAENLPCKEHHRQQTMTHRPRPASMVRERRWDCFSADKQSLWAELEACSQDAHWVDRRRDQSEVELELEPEGLSGPHRLRLVDNGEGMSSGHAHAVTGSSGARYSIQARAQHIATAPGCGLPEAGHCLCPQVLMEVPNGLQEQGRMHRKLHVGM